MAALGEENPLLCRGVLLRRAQPQGQRMHPALLRRPELRGQRGMDGAGARHPADPCESGGNEQDAVMRLPARLCAGMTGMVGAVVLHIEHAGREALSQGGADSVRSADRVCHAGIINALADLANMLAQG